ncbi:MAG: zinc ribbon domain-containing protein [Phycisphaerales bacterium]|nr:zinc ribbon domain-containing protein [Phycisphaerales bacterium]
MNVQCPHCSAPNPPESRFCGACGKALPSALPTRPVIIGEKDFATSESGRALQLDELHRRARTARNILFFLAILQLLFAGALTALGASDATGRSNGLLVLGAAVGVVGLLFLILGFWAGRNPLPASIVGLVLYATLVVGDALASPATIIQGAIIKVFIIIVLAKAVSAGVRHRQLKKHIAQSAPSHA